MRRMNKNYRINKNEVAKVIAREDLPESLIFNTGKRYNI
jgi:hypothetical protein